MWGKWKFDAISSIHLFSGKASRTFEVDLLDLDVNRKCGVWESCFFLFLSDVWSIGLFIWLIRDGRELVFYPADYVRWSKIKLRILKGVKNYRESIIRRKREKGDSGNEAPIKKYSDGISICISVVFICGRRVRLWNFCFSLLLV